jgi:hypothetical protein
MPSTRPLALIAAGAAVALLGGTQAAASTPAAVRAAMPAQSVSSTGDSVPALAAFREPAIVTLTHQGASNFIVAPINTAGAEGTSWANEIGLWSGTVFQAKESRAINAASVQADGAWSITVKPLKAAPVVPSAAYQGSGTAVVKFKSTLSSPKRITLTHDGESNFIVSPISSGGRGGASIVNEIGVFTGTVVLPKGTRYLAVNADGTWTTAIAKLSGAPVVPAAGYAGSGKSIVKLPKASKAGTRVTLTHDGESNFIVVPRKTSGKAGISLVNEIGTYSGTRVMRSGTKYLEIDADGTWTVKIG